MIIEFLETVKDCAIAILPLVITFILFQIFSIKIHKMSVDMQHTRKKSIHSLKKKLAFLCIIVYNVYNV